MLPSMATFIPSISKLSSKVFRILGCNPGPMTLQGTNTYLIGSGRRRILLDAGDANISQYTDNLISVLKDENVELEHIIITHWHHDHIGGVADVIACTGNECKVWKYKQQEIAKETLASNIPINFFRNGEIISVEGATLRVIHTPGHTTDHIVLHLKEENAIFSGDCVLGEGTAVFEDLYDYMSSLHLILKESPSIIYPGHGPVIQDPVNKIKYYIDHRNKRESQILDAMDSNITQKFTEMDLVKLIYKETPENLYPAAAVNVGHHLQKLHKENKVRKEGHAWLSSKIQSCL